MLLAIGLYYALLRNEPHDYNFSWDSNDRRAPTASRRAGSIPTEYRKSVLEQCERRVVAKGRTIWKQGDRAEYVGFLFSGKAMSSYQSRNGKSGTTGFWCAGDLLGAADLGVPGTRQMTLRCLDECVIYALTFERFHDPCAASRARPATSRAVGAAALGRRSRADPERSPRRPHRTVLLRCRAFRRRATRRVIDLKLTNEDLAAIAGVMRQFTNSTLQTYREGLLITQKRNLILTDPPALER